MNIEICILAGGLSRRMGRDKARLRIGGRSLLSHVRESAGGLGFPVRVIRRDIVPRIGPVGGVYTALKTSRGDAVLFLSCDMPFLERGLLTRIVQNRQEGRGGVFVVTDGKVGFPFLVETRELEKVAQLMLEKRHSLRELAEVVGGGRIELREGDGDRLWNINTPGEWSAACEFWKMRRNKTCC